MKTSKFLSWLFLTQSILGFLGGLIASDQYSIIDGMLIGSFLGTFLICIISLLTEETVVRLTYWNKEKTILKSATFYRKNTNIQHGKDFIYNEDGTMKTEKNYKDGEVIHY